MSHANAPVKGGRERISRARPKSAILISSVPLQSRFSGFMSRWKYPGSVTYTMGSTARTQLVHVRQALQHLVGDVADRQLRKQLRARLHDVVQIGLHVFEDHVQLVVLPNNLLQLHNVGMRQLLQRLPRCDDVRQQEFTDRAWMRIEIVVEDNFILAAAKSNRASHASRGKP